MKKFFICVFVFFISLITINQNLFAKALKFSSYNQKLLFSQTQSSNDFIELPEKSNVSLDKMWTINFSSDITTDKIEGILIQKDSDFIPANISISDNDKIIVKPITSYSANSNYCIKIFLNNNKKYKMNFTTVNAARNADTDQNGINYMHASQISLGETINGSFTSNTCGADWWYSRWYKVVVGKDCNLKLTLQQNENQLIYVYLYGKDGNNNDPIAEHNYDSKSIVNLNQGLEPGTYYIKVSGEHEGTFKMNVDYDYNISENDNEDNDTYLNSQMISENDSIKGHLGYAREDSSVDNSDFYKVTLDKDGVLDIALEQVDGNPIYLYLYGKDGDNGSEISESTKSNNSVQHISSALEAGTYYIKIANVNGNYGSYNLTTNLTSSGLENDGTNDRTYLHALNMNLGDTKTGHIGYTNEFGKTNEYDWYKVVLTSDQNINFNISTDEGEDISLYLFDKNADNDNYIDESYSDEGITNLTKTLKAGTYYIKVNSNKAQGYTINISSN